MASGAGLSGLAVSEIGAGVILAWSGIENQTLTSTLRSVIRGKAPTPGPAGPTGTVIGSDTTGTPGSTTPADVTAHSASAAQNQALARLSVAISHPTWATGTEWADWVSLWNQESGWNNLALNPSSGAFGIAQALGHGGVGTAGKYGNQYPSLAANNGQALAQIQWGISYIAQTYGSPEAAWAHEQADGWY